MTHEYLLWISLFAYASHIYEETVMDWKTWAMHISKFKNLQWTDFFVANFAVITLGVCTAMVGWKLPSFALIFPALQIINGLFFHLLPTVIYRKYSPGLITACLLFFPISLWTFWGAFMDGVLSRGVAICSFSLAALIMAMPFIFLNLRELRKS